MIEIEFSWQRRGWCWRKWPAVPRIGEAVCLTVSGETRTGVASYLVWVQTQNGGVKTCVNLEPTT